MTIDISADIAGAIDMLRTVATCGDNECSDCRAYAKRHRRNLLQVQAQLTPELRNAARYRGMRDALINQDLSFFDRMEAACPKLRDESADVMPTAEEWDAALDHVLGLGS
jgi:hypothetical protein